MEGNNATSELGTPIPTQDEMDQLINSDHMSGREMEALKRLDDKNVDRADLYLLVQSMITAYTAAKNS